MGMLLLLAIILVLMWAGGFFAFHVAGALIHLLLLFALVSLVFHGDAGDPRRHEEVRATRGTPLL